MFFEPTWVDHDNDNETGGGGVCVQCVSIHGDPATRKVNNISNMKHVLFFDYIPMTNTFWPITYSFSIKAWETF